MKEDLSTDYSIRYLTPFGSISQGDATDKCNLDILVDFTDPVGLAFVDIADVRNFEIIGEAANHLSDTVHHDNTNL